MTTLDQWQPSKADRFVLVCAMLAPIVAIFTVAGCLVVAALHLVAGTPLR